MDQKEHLTNNKMCVSSMGSETYVCFFSLACFVFSSLDDDPWVLWMMMYDVFLFGFRIFDDFRLKICIRNACNTRRFGGYSHYSNKSSVTKTNAIYIWSIVLILMNEPQYFLNLAGVKWFRIKKWFDEVLLKEPKWIRFNFTPRWKNNEN